jgi:hypothetical protein
MRFLLPAVLAALALSGEPAVMTTTPIVVELFTSEGCSDCPPADALLEKLIASPPPGAEIIGLGQHVDYWDQLGWKDRFSSAALTNRQQIYGAHFNLESVYTPQMVVDGRAQLVGSDARAAAKAIERELAAPHAIVAIDLDNGGRLFQGRQPLRVTVTHLPQPGRGDRDDVIVAITEDHLRSEVTRGENHGRTLMHAAVVRSMTTIGQATAGESSLHADISIGADWSRDELKVVAFVQEQRGRSILGASSVALRTLGR